MSQLKQNVPENISTLHWAAQSATEKRKTVAAPLSFHRQSESVCFCSYFIVSVSCGTCQQHPKSCGSLFIFFCLFFCLRIVSLHLFVSPISSPPNKPVTHCRRWMVVQGGSPDAVLPALPPLLQLPAADKCSCLGRSCTLGGMRVVGSDEVCGGWESVCRLFKTDPEMRKAGALFIELLPFFFNCTIERLRRRPLKRQQIKYADGSGNNPEGIQVRMEMNGKLLMMPLGFLRWGRKWMDWSAVWSPAAKKSLKKKIPFNIFCGWRRNRTNSFEV